MGRRFVTIMFLAIAAGGAATCAGADGGGPTPGFSEGSPGILSPNGLVRYVTITTSNETLVERIGTRSGDVLNWRPLSGFYGIAYVAGDATTTGLTRDGKWLVVASYPGTLDTRFVVLNAKTFQIRQRVALPGVWALDALSPDGTTLFLIQYLRAQNYAHYRVRAYDLVSRRLVSGSIVDRRETGPMTGSPVARTTSRDGSWAYTLYSRPSGRPFIHALDTVHRAARCIDLPWRHANSWIAAARLQVSRDDAKLYLRRQGANGRTAVVDTRSWQVRT